MLSSRVARKRFSVYWLGEIRNGPREVTAPLVYMRLRKGKYTDSETQDRAKWMRRQTVDVLCYLKHDDEAPLLAKRLLEALGMA